MSAQENFSSCILQPFERIEDPESPVVSLNAKGKWTTTSLYIDSFGRASVHLPLLLVFPSKSLMDLYLKENYIDPAPVNASVVDDTKDSSQESPAGDTDSRKATEKIVSLEAKVNLTFGTGHAITARVESVSILSSRVEDHSIVMETEVILRVSNVDEALTHGSSIMDPCEASNVKTNLEITAALVEKVSSISLTPMEEPPIRLDPTSALQSIKAPLVVRTPPLSLQVALIHALDLQIRSVPGPTMGHTFLAVQMAHSNRHSYGLRITNIALHPDASAPVKSNATASDTKNVVQWDFVSKHVHDQFPLFLTRNEAHSTVLSVNASNDSFAGSFSCPLTISVAIGSQHRPIVITTDVTWNTRCVAMEGSDSFRIQMNIENQDSEFVVGSPFTVDLEISNLSSESRHLQLLLDSDDAKKGQWKVVSERDACKFSLGGPDGDRHLLAVDTALLLGNLKGFSSSQAKLRLIPLRKGTFSIPNFKLVDSRTGQRYQCVHKLQAVVH